MATLGRNDDELRALGALATAREIAQQPAMLRKTHALLAADRSRLDDFLRPLLERTATRLILTGAGTSSFIGECLAPWLAAKLPCRAETIATTDLVSAPRLYLKRAQPTLLVSFARSGDSPESVAAVELADRHVADVHHLALTCNPHGALARKTTGSGMVVVLPEETNDQSFAMTSSFSCMTYAALALLAGIDALAGRVDGMARAVDAVIVREAPAMRALAALRHERVVYLGSHIFKGLAREAALKLLELTDGGVVAAWDSPLGFRHGPKTMVNARTLVVVFVSNDPYSRRYDLDLVEEICRDGRGAGVLVICGRDDDLPAGLERILVPGMADADDIDLLLPFVVAPQMLAFEQSIAHRLSPDRPNVSGTVHRVVQGVRIHPDG